MFTAAKHQSYLSDYKGYRLEATCAYCRRHRAYSTDDIREKMGDCQLDGLKTTIATVWGCDMVYSVNADQCGLRVEITGKINKTPDIIRNRDDEPRSKRKSSLANRSARVELSTQTQMASNEDRRQRRTDG